MLITEKTKISEIAPFIPYFEQSSIEELKRAAEGKYGSPWALTLGEFFTISEGDYSCIGVDFAHPDQITAIQYYWMKSFKDMANSLKAAIDRLTVPQTPNAKIASAGCRKMSFQESVKVFCREYFGLSSFKAVDDLTLDDFLLARKDSYNRAMFDKTMAEIRERNIKNHTS